MAILALPPLIRPRLALKQVVENVSDAQSAITSQKLDTHKFILVMACAVTLNLLVIAGINILMTQDAFTLQALKSQRNTALDKKDAILNIVNQKNSPINLSKVANQMGMIPAAKIGYLNYEELNSQVTK
jgi:GTP:adenosylcobinamide-phosphate guanylyltransferase